MRFCAVPRYCVTVPAIRVSVKPGDLQMNRFEPTRQAALTRLAAVQPDQYARSRNALEGAVTRLSPYLTHGLLSLAEVYRFLNARHPLDAQHKLVFELGWRAYYRHVWAHVGEGIHQSLRSGLLPDEVYDQTMPQDITEARTGIPAVDMAVRALYETGYVHNHARMWLASYVVHLRKVYWHVGAQWMLGHLLDGDLASNHLSWQWVAGTGSSKPYLFNAENVAKYAPVDWHSPDTVIDTSYETLDRFARSADSVNTRLDARDAGAGRTQPDLLSSPRATVWQAPDNGLATGRDVWLLHPWSISGLDGVNDWCVGTPLRIGVALAACHSANPWSERRWCFVTDGLSELTSHLWWCNPEPLAHALKGARSVRWQPDPHVDVALGAMQTLLNSGPNPMALPLAAPCLFEPVTGYCRSFSEWWRKTKLVTPA